MAVRFRAAAVCVALACLAGAPALAQKASPPADTVIVTGKAIEDEIRAFVGDIAQPEGRDGQLGRWDRSICPGIVGLDVRHAQMVLNQIARRAVAVDLQVGKPGCRANILIIITNDPGAVARELVEKHWRVMASSPSCGETTLGKKALRAFRDSKAPVRWWFVSDITVDGGRKVGDSDTGSAPMVQVYGASLLRKQTRQDFSRAFLIADSRQMDGVPFGALADYFAMASLAQIDADADTDGFPTILNLFAARAGGRAPIPEMTSWDLSYLAGLYKTQRTARDAQEQERDIARRMNNIVAPKP